VRRDIAAPRVEGKHRQWEEEHDLTGVRIGEEELGVGDRARKLAPPSFAGRGVKNPW
jgi:hypothetical protein